jgi:outer membrane lipoprotein-sorting protein
MIGDWTIGKLVTLNPADKTFSEAKFFASIQDDGKIEKTPIAAAPEVDFYKQMREFSAKDAERLPQRDIDSKSVVGFRTIEVIKRPTGTDTWTRTYWVDPVTNLPVQIEVTAESTDPHRGQSKWVQSDIVFDAPLDELLFSTDPPEGYTVRQ